MVRAVWHCPWESISVMHTDYIINYSKISHVYNTLQSLEINCTRMYVKLNHQIHFSSAETGRRCVRFLSFPLTFWSTHMHTNTFQPSPALSHPPPLPKTHKFDQHRSQVLFSLEAFPKDLAFAPNEENVIGRPREMPMFSTDKARRNTGEAVAASLLTKMFSWLWASMCRAAS